MGSFKMVRAFENEDMIINFVKIYPGNTFMLRIEEVVVSSECLSNSWTRD